MTSKMSQEETLAVVERHYPVTADLNDLCEQVGMSRAELQAYAARHEIVRTPFTIQREEAPAAEEAVLDTPNKRYLDELAIRQRVDAYAEGCDRNRIAAGVAPRYRQPTEAETKHIALINVYFADEGLTPETMEPSDLADSRRLLYGNPEPLLYELPT